MNTPQRQSGHTGASHTFCCSHYLTCLTIISLFIHSFIYFFLVLSASHSAVGSRSGRSHRDPQVQVQRVFQGLQVQTPPEGAPAHPQRWVQAAAGPQAEHKPHRIESASCWLLIPFLNQSWGFFLAASLRGSFTQKGMGLAIMATEGFLCFFASSWFPLPQWNSCAAQKMSPKPSLSLWGAGNVWNCNWGWTNPSKGRPSACMRS